MNVISNSRGKRREFSFLEDKSDIEIGDYVKNTPTTIHTRINDDIRISSAYRRYSNEHFEQWGWETLLWEGDNVKEEYHVCYSANEVVELHRDIFEKYNYK